MPVSAIFENLEAVASLDDVLLWSIAGRFRRVRASTNFSPSQLPEDDRTDQVLLGSVACGRHQWMSVTADHLALFVERRR